MTVNKNQKIFLIGTGVAAAAVFAYMKFFKTPTPPTPPAATGAAAAFTGDSQFTGGYESYANYHSADGNNHPNETLMAVNNDDRCKKLMEALHMVREALKHSGSLTADQIGTFRNQEAELMAQMKRHHCHVNTGK